MKDTMIYEYVMFCLIFEGKNDVNLNKCYSLCLILSEFLVQHSYSFCTAIQRVDFTIFSEAVCTVIAVLKLIHIM